MKRTHFCLWMVLAVASTRALAKSESINESVSKSSTSRLEVNAPNLLVGSLFSILNFALTDHFTAGPCVGIHPAYLFRPRGPELAYDVGLDSSLFFGGDRASSSWFLNPFSFYSGTNAYRTEESMIRVGFNVGYRWILKSGLSIAVGGGVYTHYSWTSVYSYSPRGRVFMDKSEGWVPVAPSLKLALGISL
jgi:hypothetical protein